MLVTIYLVRDLLLNSKIIWAIFFLSGCGLKTLPTPPQKKFTPIEKQYLKEYKAVEKKQSDKATKEQKKK